MGNLSGKPGTRLEKEEGVPGGREGAREHDRLLTGGAF